MTVYRNINSSFCRKLASRVIEMFDNLHLALFDRTKSFLLDDESKFVREVEHLPDTPLDDRGFPEAVQSVIGELAAYDHFSQRVTLIVNVVVPPGADEAALDRLFDDAVAALDTLTSDGARPLDEPLVHPPRSDDPVPPVRARSEVPAPHFRKTAAACSASRKVPRS